MVGGGGWLRVQNTRIGNGRARGIVVCLETAEGSQRRGVPILTEEAAAALGVASAPPVAPITTHPPPCTKYQPTHSFQHPPAYPPIPPTHSPLPDTWQGRHCPDGLPPAHRCHHERCHDATNVRQLRRQSSSSGGARNARPPPPPLVLVLARLPQSATATVGILCGVRGAAWQSVPCACCTMQWLGCPDRVPCIIVICHQNCMPAPSPDKNVEPLARNDPTPRLRRWA